jgi:hypothetical protein
MSDTILLPLVTIGAIFWVACWVLEIAFNIWRARRVEEET